MKKSVILLSVISMIVLKNAFSQYSQLTVFHDEGLKFWLVVNGVKHNDVPLRTVNVDKIQENFVKVKVIFEDERIADINKNVQLKNIVLGKTHTVLVIKQRNSRKAVMRFHSSSKNRKIKN